jgi:hypothetical protein
MIEKMGPTLFKINVNFAFFKSNFYRIYIFQKKFKKKVQREILELFRRTRFEHLSVWRIGRR